MLGASLIALSCGSDKGSDVSADTQNGKSSEQQDNDEQTQNSLMTLVVATTAAEPACVATNENQLIYVRDVGKFKVCASGVWSEVDIKGPKGDIGEKGDAGTAGVDGLRILSNKLLPFHQDNICTEYSAIESCYYTGGQVVKLSDGSMIVTSSYAYDLSTSAPEWDRMSSSLTLIVPPDVGGAFQKLDWWVTRTGSITGSLYFVYQRQPEKFLVIFDDDFDGPDPADEVIKDLTPANW
jgi:hypothetical protein